MGKAHRLSKQLVVVLRNDGVGMKRVPVARQGTDRQAGVSDHLPVVGELCLIREECVEIKMPVARPSAGSNLERLHLSQRLHLRQHLLDVQAAEHRGEQTKLQRTPPASSMAATFVQAPPLRWLSRTASTSNATR